MCLFEKGEIALRVYEKNGFVRVNKLERKKWHEEIGQDCWLIEKNRSNEEM